MKLVDIRSSFVNIITDPSWSEPSTAAHEPDELEPIAALNLG